MEIDDKLIKDLRDAIHKPGYWPEYHYNIMRKQSKEWPTLWKAINNILRATNDRM